MRILINIALFLLLLPLAAAHACSCFGPGPVCSIQLGTSTIFRGTVIERTLIEDVHTIQKADGTPMQVFGNGKFKVRFAVHETFSGPAGAEAIVYTAQQSSACGFPFAVGSEYLVFTSSNEGALWTSHCSRTTLLQPGVETKPLPGCEIAPTCGGVTLPVSQAPMPARPPAPHQTRNLPLHAASTLGPSYSPTLIR